MAAVKDERRRGSRSMSERAPFLPGLAVITGLAALLALSAGPVLAKRISGTSGADTIVGTKKADRINARGGNDRVKGRDGGDRIKGARGKDRLAGGKGGDRLKGSAGKDRVKGGKGRDRISAGKGADRLKAVDDKRDRVVNGGAGNDVCTIDQIDLPAMKNCEEAKVKTGPGAGPGGGGSRKLRVTSASGLTCGSGLPRCPFEIVGKGAEAPVGTVSGGGGVTLAAGAGVVIDGNDWTANGLYGCSADGYIKVTIGSKSVRVPITCTS
jgi:Ca2+-binding RTX toxin-like protein